MTRLRASGTIAEGTMRPRARVSWRKAVPKSIVIMGSGAVGVEFASIFRSFGADVTIIELLPRLVPVEDEAVSAELQKSFRKKGITVLTGTKVTSAKAVADGVRIVLKQFLDTLEKMGIKRIPTLGKPFDPSLHEAIQQLSSTEHPAGVIMAEVQPGYSIGDYLLRAAMVVVSKGSPEADPTTN